MGKCIRCGDSLTNRRKMCRHQIAPIYRRRSICSLPTFFTPLRTSPLPMSFPSLFLHATSMSHLTAVKRLSSTKFSLNFTSKSNPNHLWLTTKPCMVHFQFIFNVQLVNFSFRG
ncbi:hypothetical protein MRX96_012690 [Rhipicephalus microplus]